MVYRGKKACIATLLLTLLAALCGCGSKGTGNESQANAEVQGETQEATQESAASVINFSDEEMFTNRDMDASYEESSATTIILADSASESSSTKDVKIEGNTITITDEGTYIITGSLADGQLIVDAEKTDKLQIVLKNVDISCSSSAPIYVKQADKVFVTLAEDSKNTLSVVGEYVAIDDNNIDAAIFSKDDLTFNGSGSLTIDAQYGHGIVSKDDLVFTGGNYQISAQKHGLSANDSIRVSKGDFIIKAVEDGLHSSNDEDDSLGFVYLSDGNFMLTVGDDGIHASSNVVINGGNIDITESYEGIEGLTIDIYGGNISVVASDDGLNAAGRNDGSSFGGGREDIFAVDENCYINIHGGTLYVDADGDGIDSNGNLTVTGGEIYVAGAENNGDGAIDYEGEGVISGGVVVAVGQNGMAMNFGNNSTQGTMLVNLQSQATGELTLTDDAGNVLVSYSTDKMYNSIVISCPEIQEGKTYHVTAGGQSVDVEMTSLVYGNGGMGMGPGGGMNPSGMGPGGGMNPGGMGPEGGMNPGSMGPGGGMNPGGMEPEGGMNPGGMELDGGKNPEDGTLPDGGERPEDETFSNDGTFPQDGAFPSGEERPDGGMKPGGGMSPNGNMKTDS